MESKITDPPTPPDPPAKKPRRRRREKAAPTTKPSVATSTATYRNTVTGRVRQFAPRMASSLGSQWVPVASPE